MITKDQNDMETTSALLVAIA